MRCPRCKKEIKNNSIKCDYCNAKIGTICTDCSTYNPITAAVCSHCGKTLLKICSECNSANLPDAKSCRKCGIDFISEEEQAELKQPIYFASTISQQKVKAKLIERIKDGDKKIITLSGESGCGKNLVLRHAIYELKNAKLIWLMGTCTQITQLSPFGYIQDLLLNFFNINNFCPDTLQLKKNSVKFFKQDFPSLSNNEIIDLLNDKTPSIFFTITLQYTRQLMPQYTEEEVNLIKEVTVSYDIEKQIKIWLKENNRLYQTQIIL